MNNKNLAVLCFLLLVYFVNQDAFAEKEDKSEELEVQLEGNFSSEASGPLDSHEAMNNRDLSSKLSKSNREKRSYEFLMGLVNNNSRFEVTNVDLPPPEIKKKNDHLSTNEALLELMVKIASNPDQWDKVHKLLRKIDNDLMISKKLYDTIQDSVEEVNNFTRTVQKELFSNKKQQTQSSNTTILPLVSSTSIQDDMKPTELKDNITSIEETELQNMSKRNSSDELHKVVVILNNSRQKTTNNLTETALKSNEWPNFETESKILYKPETDVETSRYPWPTDVKSGSKSYQRNFAYHRVTGHPLYHTNLDKNPKAYIAVSVIAPKPLHSKPQEEDLILENELRQLKPWTHKQNLKNMAAMRSRWNFEKENKAKEAITP